MNKYCLSVFFGNVIETIYFQTSQKIDSCYVNTVCEYGQNNDLDTFVCAMARTFMTFDQRFTITKVSENFQTIEINENLNITKGN
jgi:hypothetical protein